MMRLTQTIGVVLTVASSLGCSDRVAKPTLPAVFYAVAPAVTSSFELVGDTLRPAAWRWLVDVSFPIRADGWFELRAGDADFTLRARLQGARSTPAELIDGTLVYRGGAAPYSDIMIRTVADGFEDYVSFTEPPPAASLRYDLELGHDVATVRLVGNVVELLDRAGTPQLRVANAVVIDAAGLRRSAELSLEGCAEATSGPTRSCALGVTWDDSGLRYPLIVDPKWTGTDEMIASVVCHTAAALPDGSVMVAGGYDDDVSGPTDKVQRLDPTTLKWSALPAMATPRGCHTSATLDDGRVLVAGGEDDKFISTATAELFDPKTQTWSEVLPLPETRYFGVAVVLPEGPHAGKVMLAGGAAASVQHALLFDPTSENWAKTATQSTSRSSFTLTPLTSGPHAGKVLVAGGYDSGSVDLVELYDPAADTWEAAEKMPRKRANHTATRLESGDVVIIGGQGGLPWAPLIFSAASGTWTEPSVATIVKRQGGHSATLLGNGLVLIAGGHADSKLHAAAELFDAKTNSFAAAGYMSAPRDTHSATLLKSGPLAGSVVFAGGGSVDGDKSADVFTPDPSQDSCIVDGDCASGHCANGVCCESNCDGVCMACSAVAKGHGIDGVCEPVTASTDPREDCTDTGATVCQQNGVCDGSGACQLYPVQSGCAPATCAVNSDCSSGFCREEICCDRSCNAACEACTKASKGHGTDGLCAAVLPAVDDACPAADHCAGAAILVLADGSEHACTPYSCDEASSACQDSCSVSADCAGGYLCEFNHKCVNYRPPVTASCGLHQPLRTPLNGNARVASSALALLALVLIRRRRSRARP